VTDRRWARGLPSGAIIEVIGVSSFPSGPNTWWRPDGTPLHPAPCDPTEPGISGGNVVRKLVVVRLARIPDGADQQWSITEASGRAEGPAMRDGKPLPGLRETTALLPADAGTCTVLFKVAAGPWITIQTCGKGQGAAGTLIGSYIFGGAIATQKGTFFTVTHDLKGVAVRLVAVDVDGKEHPGVIRSGSGVKDFQQIGVEFELPPDQIKEFRVQTRPYERVEVPGIALKRK
jgi:hypothetical protein